MPSVNKTHNIGLNQWQGNEYPKRQDFVDDNLLIDTEIGKRALKTEVTIAQNSAQTYADNKVSSITGNGWNNETIKGNAVAIANLQQESALHLEDITQLIFQLAVQDLINISNIKHIFVDKIESSADVSLISGMYANSKVYI
ncbi:hypothetical protein [Clostridium sp. JN-9]|uniref:hypothetical protein n=1 Tax=Clostridium sp. JN-9 TaxID=2507159 RepID=UPI000FFE26C4|nr:hypothetical protein [Clostridium sp. JN-9]QAT40824.1 hypothetical protein EQM05_11440 [Clostridium sp. JN-9]